MNELSRRQIRALVLLLVLLPLIPTTLMLRLMMLKLQSEQEASEEQTRETYQRALGTIDASLAAQLVGSAETDDLSSRVFEVFRRIFEGDVSVHLTTEDGKLLQGQPLPPMPPLAGITLRQIPGNWRIGLYSNSNAAKSIGFASYGWIAGGAVIANLALASMAAYTLNRQIQLHELNSTRLASVSHELKTPLASMRVLIETLGSRPLTQDTQLSEYLELLGKENARLTHITEMFLAAAQTESGSYRYLFESMHPSDLFALGVEAGKPELVKAGACPVIDAPASVPRISVDKQTMVIAIRNLVDNAVKFTGPSRQITLRASETGGYVFLDVIDNGVGIARSEQRKVFGRFYQTDQKLSRAHEGIGLGLSIVKTIVEAHRGQVSIRSEPNRGSMVRIRLRAIS